MLAEILCFAQNDVYDMFSQLISTACCPDFNALALRIWIGNMPMSVDMLFDVPKDYAKQLCETKKEGSGYKIVDGAVKSRAQAIWFTNLDIAKRHEKLILYKTYNPEEYPKYDNYDAINVNTTKDIPVDYDGVMGVPITFLDKYNPEQFEILGIDRYIENNPRYGHRFSIDGKEILRTNTYQEKEIEP